MAMDRRAVPNQLDFATAFSFNGASNSGLSPSILVFRDPHSVQISNLPYRLPFG